MKCDSLPLLAATCRYTCRHLPLIAATCRHEAASGGKQRHIMFDTLLNQASITNFLKAFIDQMTLFNAIESLFSF